MKASIISVIMPVYNGQKYLDESIYSILNQTMSDFEFIIYDDYSTDSSVDIIRSFKGNILLLRQLGAVCPVF